jgi:hypothetical protein
MATFVTGREMLDFGTDAFEKGFLNQACFDALLRVAPRFSIH